MGRMEARRSVGGGGWHPPCSVCPMCTHSLWSYALNTPTHPTQPTHMKPLRSTALKHSCSPCSQCSNVHAVHSHCWQTARHKCVAHIGSNGLLSQCYRPRTGHAHPQSGTRQGEATPNTTISVLLGTVDHVTGARILIKVVRGRRTM